MNSFSKRGLAGLAILMALTVAGCGGSSDGSVGISDPNSFSAGMQGLPTTFGATLVAEGQQSVAPGNATGSATVVIDPLSRLAVVVVATSGVVPTSATIRQAVSGVSDPALISLSETPPGSGVLSASVTLTDEQIDALRREELYVEVTSVNAPGGALRGRIVPQRESLSTLPGGATSGASPIGNGAFGTPGVPSPGFGTGLNAPASFSATLRGDQVVPPTPSVAQGSGTVTVNPATGQMAAAVAVTGIAPTAVTIRRGEPGRDGEVVHALTESGSGNGVWLARAFLSAEELQEMLAGNLHFNVQSAAFPQGELRGQLVPQQPGAAAVDGLVPRFGGLPDIGLPTAGGGFTGVFPGVGIPGASGVIDTGAGIFDRPGVTGPDFGLSGFSGAGTGAAGSSSTGFGSTGFGSTGFGSTGFGSTGFGSTGFGSTGFAATPSAADSLSPSTPSSVFDTPNTITSIGFGSPNRSTVSF